MTPSSHFLRGLAGWRAQEPYLLTPSLASVSNGVCLFFLCFSYFTGSEIRSRNPGMHQLCGGGPSNTEPTPRPEPRSLCSSSTTNTQSRPPLYADCLQTRTPCYTNFCKLLLSLRKSHRCVTLQARPRAQLIFQTDASYFPECVS